MKHRRGLCLTLVMAMLLSLAMAPVYGESGPESFQAREVIVREIDPDIYYTELSFMPPESTTGVTRYMLAYSVRDIDQVWEALKSKTSSDFDNYDSSRSNQGKYLSLSAADGSYQYFYRNQKDIITGGSFSDQEIYHLYVLTLGRNGILGIAEANQVINKAPGVGSLELVRQGGYDLTDYSVRLGAASSSQVRTTLVFYSDRGYSYIAKETAEMTPQQAQLLAEQGRGQLVSGTGAQTAALQGLKDFDGLQRDETKAYYVYALSLSDIAARGLVKADGLLVPERGPEPLSSIGNGQGAVIPAGGSTSINPSSSVFVQGYIDAIKEATGNSVPRLAVLSASSGSETLIHDTFYQYGDTSDSVLLERLGFEPVYIPLGIDNYASVTEETYFADLIRSCHAVMLMGGDQAKHARTLIDDNGGLTAVGQAVADVYENGGTIVGTSAGGAVMGNPTFMDGGEYSYEAMYWNSTEWFELADYNGKTDPALGSQRDRSNMAYYGTGYVDLAAGRPVVIDTHFDARGRLGRMAVALRDLHSDGLALGIDEGTGIRISDGAGTVFGRGGVFILDGSSVQWGAAGSGNVFRGEDLTLHYLTEGDSFSFETGAVTVASDKTRIVESSQVQPFETSAAFGSSSNGGYVTSKLVNTFIRSNAQEVTRDIARSTSSPFSSGPKLEITMGKTSETEGYISSDCYQGGSPGSSLGQYQKVTAAGLSISIGLEGTTEGPGTNPPGPEPDDDEYAPKEVRLTQTGTATYDVRIRFLAPSKRGDVVEYMLVYSAEEKDSVWNSLKNLSSSELEDLYTARMARIVPLTWDDGEDMGYSSNQLDVVTGRAFSEPGVCHFYVVSLGSNGALGLAEADQTIEK